MGGGSGDILDVFAWLQQIYEQLLERGPLKVVGHAKYMQSIIRSGLKYNEASKCNFVLHATLSIIHVERKKQQAKNFPRSTNTLFWGLLMMATMNILALVKSFVFLGSRGVCVSSMSKKDMNSHAEANHFHLQYPGSNEVILCVHYALY